MSHHPSSKEKKILKQQYSGREFTNKSALGIVGSSKEKLFAPSPDRQNINNGFAATKEQIYFNSSHSK